MQSSLINKLVHFFFFSNFQMKLSDPINQISLENSLRDNLQTCAALHGDSFNTAMSKMHPAALAQLKQALNIID